MSFMKIKIFAIFFCTNLLINNTYAAIVCPDVTNIKKGNYQGWLPLNNLDDEPATPHEKVEFQRTIQEFTGATWSPEYNYGFGRCNYNSDIEVSLASNNYPTYTRPVGTHWTWDGIIANCQSRSLLECIFSSAWVE